MGTWWCNNRHVNLRGEKTLAFTDLVFACFVSWKKMSMTNEHECCLVTLWPQRNLTLQMIILWHERAIRHKQRIERSASTATLQLQVPQLDPELGLLSLWSVFACSPCVRVSFLTCVCYGIGDIHLTLRFSCIPWVERSSRSCSTMCTICPIHTTCHCETPWTHFQIDHLTSISVHFALLQH